MMHRLRCLLPAEDGQDIVEYSLLLAFIIFTMIGLAIGFGNNIKGITSTSNSQIDYANHMVS